MIMKLPWVKLSRAASYILSITCGGVITWTTGVLYIGCAVTAVLMVASKSILS
jgi:hypothetical protein